MHIQTRNGLGRKNPVVRLSEICPWRESGTPNLTRLGREDRVSNSVLGLDRTGYRTQVLTHTLGSIRWRDPGHGIEALFLKKKETFMSPRDPDVHRWNTDVSDRLYRPSVPLYSDSITPPRILVITSETTFRTDFVYGGGGEENDEFDHTQRKSNERWCSYYGYRSWMHCENPRWHNKIRGLSRSGVLSGYSIQGKNGRRMVGEVKRIPFVFGSLQSNGFQCLDFSLYPP